RYGFKKTSMDDLARSVGLSRQGLYLHFKTKEELFQAAILNIMEGARTAYQAALARSDLPLLDRLLGAFVAFHGCHIGQLDEQYVGEILEAASSLLGDAPAEHERRFIADVAKLLGDAGEARRAGAPEVSPRELAEALCATSFGWKHRVATPAEYRDRMAIALRIALPGNLPGNKGTKTVPARKR
ncbi:MAG TPA: TetR/AcrR family transcriptional regulator, partial [Polyangiaceae bacterium]|nr:TetR/AcrR family transcriptional regulator [Polyangiaceae bacterium]